MIGIYNRKDEKMGDKIYKMTEFMRDVMMEVEEELGKMIPEEEEISSWHQFSDGFLHKMQTEVLKHN